MYYTLEHDNADWKEFGSQSWSATESGITKLPASEPNNEEDVGKNNQTNVQLKFPEKIFNEQERLYKELDMVLKVLKKIDVDGIFVNRVSKREAPDYYEVIERPMYFNLMAKKLRKLEYRSKESFQADLDLIFANCRQYNTDPESFYRAHADLMESKAKELMLAVPDIDLSYGSVPDEDRPQASKSSLQRTRELKSEEDRVERKRGPGRPRKRASSYSTEDSAVPVTDTGMDGSLPLLSSLPEDPYNDPLRFLVPSSPAQSPISPTQQGCANVSPFASEVARWSLLTRRYRLSTMDYRHAQFQLPFGERETLQRTPARMASFLSENVDSPLCCPELFHYLDAVPEILPSNESHQISVSTRQYAQSLEAHYPNSQSNFETTLSLPQKRFVYYDTGQSVLLLSKAIFMILTEVGFDGISQLANDVLVDATVGYFSKLGKLLRLEEEHAQQNCIDILGDSLHQMGVQFEELRHYLSLWKRKTLQ